MSGEGPRVFLCLLACTRLAWHRKPCVTKLKRGPQQCRSENVASQNAAHSWKVASLLRQAGIAEAGNYPVFEERPVLRIFVRDGGS
jgi:hypothetical protein